MTNHSPHALTMSLRASVTMSLRARLRERSNLALNLGWVSTQPQSKRDCFGAFSKPKAPCNDVLRLTSLRAKLCERSNLSSGPNQIDSKRDCFVGAEACLLATTYLKAAPYA